MLLEFLERTREGPRYLWTDALALESLAALAARADEARYLDLGKRLVESVHHTLGRHRPDDSRSGWLSGLSEAEGARRPTVAGLRIGKPLPERGPEEPLDRRLEWDRDGQYFHYLTRWARALLLFHRVAPEAGCDTWARELLHTAHRAFCYRTPSGPRLYWKMSIDLRRPLVTSMGQHDALDGLVVCLLAGEAPELQAAMSDFEDILAEQDLLTTDPLGMGGLLLNANAIEDVIAAVGAERAKTLRRLRQRLLKCVSRGLEFYKAGVDERDSAEGRLGFRELGLAQGLRALRGADDLPESLAQKLTLGLSILNFWERPQSRATATWSAHRDINEMSLVAAQLA